MVKITSANSFFQENLSFTIAVYVCYDVMIGVND